MKYIYGNAIPVQKYLRERRSHAFPHYYTTEHEQLMQAADRPQMLLTSNVRIEMQQSIIALHQYRFVVQTMMDICVVLVLHTLKKVLPVQFDTEQRK